MAGPTVNFSILPMGGAIRLDMPGYVSPPSGVTSMTLSRAVSGILGLSAFTDLYSGAPLPVWFDPGDRLPGPLNPASGWVYSVADVNGTTQVGPIYPAMTIRSEPDALTQLFIRLLQCGVANAILPTGVNRPMVDGQMPQGGWLALPFVVVNLDLLQQTETEIGEEVTTPDVSGVWTIPVYASRLWRTSVFARNGAERDYWRDTLLAVMRVMLPSVFLAIGVNVRHRFQAASSTDSREWEGHIPGFYAADIMFEVDGVLDVALFAPYGVMETIDATATFAGGAEQSTEVPSASGI